MQTPLPLAPSVGTACCPSAGRQSPVVPAVPAVTGLVTPHHSSTWLLSLRVSSARSTCLEAVMITAYASFPKFSLLLKNSSFLPLEVNTIMCLP